MKRIESDPEEIAEIEEALQRAAAPMHAIVERSEQPTEEFDSRAVIEGLRLAEGIELGTE